MVGSDAYIKGNSVEIGIAGLGGYEGVPESTSPPPAGMHARSSTNLFGFVANPQLNSWAGSAYDGDFFTPGSPENGWGFETDTSSGGVFGGNNCTGLIQIPGSVTSWTHASSQTICEWEGNDTLGAGLNFKINYQLDDTALFYITTISIKNNTSTVIPDLYYYRNIDPDNNEEIGGGYATQNTIVSQITAGGSITSVTATQSLPWVSSFNLLAIDSNWVAGYGGFSNRYATNMYTGIGGDSYTQTVGAKDTADVAIYLAYKITNLAPGITHTFKFATIFDTASVAAAISALNLSTVSTHDLGSLENSVKVYPNPFTDNTTISIGNAVVLSNAEIHVYDVVGKEVKIISNIQSHQFIMDRSGLSNGMYFYKLINKGQVIGSGKLVIK
ncbi:MAG: T9SS type A sorting domain-containing protein [Bacteroidia bacterium]